MDDPRLASLLDTPATRRRALAALAAFAGLTGSRRETLALPPSPIRVTGGGWLSVFAPSGPPIRVTFGFQVRQLPPNPIQGTFELHNHATGFRLHSTQFTDLVAGERFAQLSGLVASVDSDTFPVFTVQVTEGNSEDPPFFSITSDVATVAGFLGGGSIKVEAETTAP